ncbi:hypothetical protein GCK32_008355 [Trichostrongylus colubriformis]|uniref:Uncharacterized protein n=1 Tax=Trichostrongylus colubriformis TaxID=6319 RepID=A0AAN8FFY6_TRICO
MAKVPNLSAKRRRQVRRIMDISLSESLCGVDDSMSVRTLEDLQRLIRKGRRTLLQKPALFYAIRKSGVLYRWVFYLAAQ